MRKPFLSILAPVVVAELKRPRSKEVQVPIEPSEPFCTVESLKLRLKSRTSKFYGNLLSVQFKLELLCLLLKADGGVILEKRDEICQDQISILEFTGSIHSKDNIKFHLQIKDISWDGGKERDFILFKYLIKYMVIVTSEQIINLSEEKNQNQEDFRQLEEEISRIRDENRNLKNTLLIYERNIRSLKKGIKKLEEVNAKLKSYSPAVRENGILYNQSPAKGAFLGLPMATRA